MASGTNTGSKDAKGRTIYSGPKGGKYVMTSGGKKAKPAKGRLTKKHLENKAKLLSAKRVALNEKAKMLSAKRVQLEAGAQFLNDEARRIQAQETMRRLNALAAKKAANAKSAVRKLY